jgi:hypothetical protein
MISIANKKFLQKEYYSAAELYYKELIKNEKLGRNILFNLLYTICKISQFKNSTIIGQNEVINSLLKLFDNKNQDIDFTYFNRLNNIMYIIQNIAEKNIIDRKYISSIYRENIDNSYYAAILYYTKNIRYKSISPFFNNLYYNQINNLNIYEDEIQHFIMESNNEIININEYLTIDREVFNNKFEIFDLLKNKYKDKSILKLLKIEITPEVKQLIESNGLENEYNATIYREFNEDLESLNEEELYNHWNNDGIKEGRIVNIKTMLTEANSQAYFLPLNFNSDEYLEVNHDLKIIKQKKYKWWPIWHYLKHGMSEGRAYNWEQNFGFYQNLKNEPLSQEINIIEHKEINLCVLVHLYYVEMWDEIQEKLININYKFDLYINLVDSNFYFSIFDKIRKQYPNSNIFISENKGRDIGGFFKLMDKIKFDKYFAFVMLHSKKSPHVSKEYSKRWKNNLINAIIGSEKILNNNIQLLMSHPTVGLIGSIKHRNVEIALNSKFFHQALDLFEISLPNREIEFVSGTMMIIKSEIIKELYLRGKCINFEDGDNKSLEFNIDGQWAHAVERIIGNLTKELGYILHWR